MYSIINIPYLQDDRGSLSFIEFEKHINFPIKRVYWLYHLSTYSRGFHAHKELKQLLIILQGSCNIILDNTIKRETIHLHNPNIALLINPLVWRELVDFSNNPIIMVFASALYDEQDYIRNYRDFLKYVRSFY